MNRSHSTISREIQRNGGKKGYRYKQAQELSVRRRSSASSAPTKMTRENISLIKEQMLDTQPSPRQLSGCLKRNYDIHISHETIYKFIWDDKRSGGKLYLNLRRKAKKYNKRASKTAGRGLIPNCVDIEQRPAIVEEKSRFGDFELDTIVGAKIKELLSASWIELVSIPTLAFCPNQRHKMSRKHSTKGSTS